MALTQLPGNQVKDSSLKNADIASDAAIDITKLALPTSLPEKATPVDADVFTGSDSVASNVWKKFTWANIKATLKTYFDTLYGSMNNPMTASGDIIYGGTSGAPTRLAKGTDAQVLTLASGVPAWASAGGGFSLVNRETNFDTSSSSYVDVTGMTLSVTANKKYLLLLSFLGKGYDASNRIEVQLTFPANASLGGNATGFYRLSATSYFVIGVQYASTPVVLNGYSEGTYSYHGIFILNVGATAGSLTLQVKNRDAGGQNVTVYAGTNMSLTEASQ